MDEIQKWFLEHAPGATANDPWESLASEIDIDEYALSAEGFKQFQNQVRKENPWWRRTLRTVERVAAILMVPLAVTVAVLAFKKPDQVQWSEVYTQAGQTRSVTLPDGSVIRLAPESQVLYPSSFDKDSRKIFLRGEVYADITHMDSCPFEICSEDITITVYGTEFNFSSYPSDAECELALVDGSVEMTINGKSSNHAIKMKSGEIVRYERRTGSVEKQRFSADTFLSNSQRGGLQFSNRKMEDIARCLERKFDTRIVIEDAAIAQERYFASFINGEDLPAILQSLNTQNNIKISQKDNIYYLTRK